MIDNIYSIDCLTGMKVLPDCYIDLTITSPPYDNLRTYDEKGDFNFKKFKLIANELYRITKYGGIVVWVIGDATVKGSETCSSFKQILYFKDIGFRLHDTMIYEKGGMTYPSINRYYQTFEYMFVLSKGKPKTTNLIKDRKNKWAGHKAHWGEPKYRNKNGELVTNESVVDDIIPEFSIRNNIWRYPIGKGNSSRDDIAFKHPAIFPEKLVEDHILSWSNEGDLIFDPMCGSGTTCKMALKNNRHYLGFDINEKYVENIAKPRLEEFKKCLKESQ